MCIHGYIHRSLAFILCVIASYISYTYIYYLAYYISVISTYIERYNNTVYHSGEITSSYSQNLVYLLSSNRYDIKHQGKTSGYLLSPGQRNLIQTTNNDIQTTIII